MYSGLHTTASAPSMRAAEPYAAMAPPPINDDPGNVKVVVRCRAFVRRGRRHNLCNCLRTSLTHIREGKGNPMPHSHGPRDTKDDTICAG